MAGTAAAAAGAGRNLPDRTAWRGREMARPVPEGVDTAGRDRHCTWGIRWIGTAGWGRASIAVAGVDTAVGDADTAGVGDTAVVAVPAVYAHCTLVDHPVSGHRAPLPGTTCPASPPTSLQLSSAKKDGALLSIVGLTLLCSLLLCIPVQLPTHSVSLFRKDVGVWESM